MKTKIISGDIEESQFVCDVLDGLSLNPSLSWKREEIMLGNGSRLLRQGRKKLKLVDCRGNGGENLACRLIVAVFELGGGGGLRARASAKLNHAGQSYPHC